MTTEKVAGEFVVVHARERLVTRHPLRADASVRKRSTPPRALSVLLSVIAATGDVMSEAHRMRFEAERRYPHLNFDC